MLTTPTVNAATEFEEQMRRAERLAKKDSTITRRPRRQVRRLALRGYLKGF